MFDKIDAFCRWIDRRFLVLGDEIPQDIRVCWHRFWRVIDYIPIIWHDWDFNCEPGIFELMKKKLERLKPELVHHVNADEDRRKIKICIELLNRIITDKYEDDFAEAHDKKWGKAKWRFEPCEDRPGYSTLHFDRKHAVTDEEKERCRREFLKGCKHAARQKQRAIDYVMKMVGKWAQNWWD